MSAWVVWSEEYGCWWCSPTAPFLVSSNVDRYTRRLMRAGLYTEVRARQIMRETNAVCAPGDWRVWAFPDPLLRTV
jgi:hypothetical protein